jgi:hypothetical protein
MERPVSGRELHPLKIRAFSRRTAIETLTALADESTEEVIATSIATLRYSSDEVIRRAVETAVNKLQNKANLADRRTP